MPSFSKHSVNNLSTADHRLRVLFERVVQEFDCTVITGHRSKKDQDAAVAAGNSKTKWPNSKHNSVPAQAVDVIPYPVDWDDRERMSFFAGFVKGVALSMGIKIRWGGDWDQDTEVKDNSFDDLVHFELVD